MKLSGEGERLNREEKNFWRNNNPKLPKFDKKFKFLIDPGSTDNSNIINEKIKQRNKQNHTTSPQSSIKLLNTKDKEKIF